MVAVIAQALIQQGLQVFAVDIKAVNRVFYGGLCGVTKCGCNTAVILIQ
jgi:hypothetical protein